MHKQKNREAVDSLRTQLLPLDRSRFRGVCYYGELDGCWVGWDQQGRRLPRHCLPVREAQAFTISDEAHCRGADLQLRVDAAPLVTLCPAMCKTSWCRPPGGCASSAAASRCCASWAPPM